MLQEIPILTMGSRLQTLSRFTPHQNAMAKAKIHQILLEITFRPEPMPSPQCLLSTRPLNYWFYHETINKQYCVLMTKNYKHWEVIVFDVHVCIAMKPKVPG